MSSQDKIDRILAWAADKPWFDTEFVEDLDEKLGQYEELTTGQENALDNIIEKFNIDSDGDDDYYRYDSEEEEEEQ